MNNIILKINYKRLYLIYWLYFRQDNQFRDNIFIYDKKLNMFCFSSKGQKLQDLINFMGRRNQ